MNAAAARPLRIGLTGGIGSGKTAVADMLAERGAAVFDADAIAHALTAAGGAAIEPLRQAFGPAMITPEGALDRARMRELIFADAGAKLRLEALLHPLIAAEVEHAAAADTGAYQVFVVPLLVEGSSRWAARVDRICVVDCDEPTQVRRVRVRSNLAPDLIARIMAAQVTRAQRLAAADDVILNDGATSRDQLAARVQVRHQEWLRLAEHESFLRPGGFQSSK